MSTPDPVPANASEPPPSDRLRQSLVNAARFWEPRRLLYNFVLTVIVFTWVVATWPHFRPALTLSSFLIFCVLGLLANLCYCAAYFVDIPLQHSSIASVWRRWRWTLWALGMLLAIVLENYWISDEIYPFVR